MMRNLFTALTAASALALAMAGPLTAHAEDDYQQPSSEQAVPDDPAPGVQDIQSMDENASDSMDEADLVTIEQSDPADSDDHNE